jgi:hypothetical protein
MNSTDITPKPLGRFDAENTTTPISAVGVHPITGEVECMGFSSDAELFEHLSVKGRADTHTVYDLDRATGEWVLRAQPDEVDAEQQTEDGAYEAVRSALAQFGLEGAARHSFALGYLQATIGDSSATIEEIRAVARGIERSL